MIGFTYNEIKKESLGNHMVKNLTHHPVVIYKNGSVFRIIEPEGPVPRCNEERVQVGEIDEIPFTNTRFGIVQDLPEKKEGVFLIVSPIVANALPERDDLLVPDNLVRDEQGNIIGCRALARVSWWGCEKFPW